MSISFMWAYKTGLWANTMNYSLWSFNESRIFLTVAVSKDKASYIIRVSFFNGVAFFSWPLMSAKIYSLLVVLWMTLIPTYWSDALNKPNLVNSSLNQVVFFDIRAKAIYLASINNRATVACFLVYLLTRSLLSIKTKPDVDFLIAWSPTLLESESPF